jgi:glycosyltransferase involved in cell wall biosynthesis
LAKILYIWKSPFPWDVRVDKICKSLAKNNEVMVASRWAGEKEQVMDYNGFKVHRIGYSHEPSLIKQKLLFPIEWNPIWKNGLDKLISEYKPDLVIHREMFLTDIVLGLKKKHVFKLIADIAEHYPFLIEYWDHYNPFLKFLAIQFNYYYKLEQRLVENSDYTWTVIEENSKRLAEYSDSITEIYNSPYLKKNTEKSNSTKVRFAYHGYINKERNLELFINTFHDLSEELDNIQLDIYGGGPMLEELNALAQKKANKNITVHGSYEFNELKTLLKACDIGILPYGRNLQYDNTLSNKFFDYAFSNTTILCSDNPPMKRLVDMYQLGYTYQAEDEESLINTIKTAYHNVLETRAQDNSVFINAGFDWASMEDRMNESITKVLK